MTLLDALLAKRDPVAQRAISPSMIPWGRGELDIGVDDATGVRVNRDTALGVSAVWACVSLISDSVATLPIDTYTRQAGVLKQYKPRPGWLDVPNPEQTSVDFKFGTVASLLLDGNAFFYTVRDRKGEIVEVWCLDPRWVQVRREFQDDGSLALNYYVMVGKGMQSPVGPFKVSAGSEMFHIMAFQPNSSWPRGIGPLEVARLMFGSGIAGQELGARYFGHGMNASGVIEVEDELTIEQARELKQDFGNSNSGLRKMHLPPVLTGGAVWKQIQISPEQAQFIEQRKFSVDEIARFFRVPPHMIGNLEKTTSWGTGIEQQSIGFVRYTLRPWLERIEDAWSRYMLLFQPGVQIRFDVDALLRGDSAAQADYWQKRFMSGSASANDQRKAFGEEPIEKDGDVYYFPVNMAPVGTEPLKIGKEPAEDAPPTPGEAPPVGVGDVGAPARSLNGHGRDTVIIPVPGEGDGFEIPDRMIDAVEELARSIGRQANRQPDPAPTVNVAPATAPEVHVAAEKRPRGATVRRNGDTLEVTYHDEDEHGETEE